MRELFEICPKIVFLTCLVLWSFEGSELGRKRCKILCSYVSRTVWKNSLLKP